VICVPRKAKRAKPPDEKMQNKPGFEDRNTLSDLIVRKILESDKNE